MTKESVLSNVVEEEPAEATENELQPVAIVRGEQVLELPKDLYIPPDALEVILETFEGPLDLLLYLIRKQNLEILDIPIASITAQYMEYVEIMRALHLELAAEYLVMAAILAEIKSRMLLPRPEKEEDVEDDPRAELIRRLQEYERFKQAAEDLNELPRSGRDNFPIKTDIPVIDIERPEPEVDFQDIMVAFLKVMERCEMTAHHKITREVLSVRERMSQLLDHLSADEFCEFPTLFCQEEGRMGAVVTLLALLELIRGAMVELVQNEVFGPIHVKAVG